ncbi:uncharacterized protein LOC144656232 [Oculina patagonica]
MKPATAFALFLAFLLLEGCRVKGRCGTDDLVANTTWVACLAAENNVRNGNCPHGFLKLPVTCPMPSARYSNGQRVPWKHWVCCLIHPTYDLKIKEAPCTMSSPPRLDKEQTKTHRHH